MEGPPPVASKQRTAEVRGVRTQVVCTAFGSHILVLVTQCGKVGTLVALEPGAAAGDIGRPALATRVLLGRDEVRRGAGGQGEGGGAGGSGQRRGRGPGEPGAPQPGRASPGLRGSHARPPARGAGLSPPISVSGSSQGRC